MQWHHTMLIVTTTYVMVLVYHFRFCRLLLNEARQPAPAPGKRNAPLVLLSQKVAAD